MKSIIVLDKDDWYNTDGVNVFLWKDDELYVQFKERHDEGDELDAARDDVVQQKAICFKLDDIINFFVKNAPALW
jgi:hypothetical protein